MQSERVFLIDNKMPRIFTVHHEEGLVRFMPAVNAVPESDWKKIEKNKLLQERFNAGALAFVVGKGPEDYFERKSVASANDGVQGDASDDPSNPLDGLNAKDSVAAVEKILDINLLERLAKIETRKGVLKAIEAQLEIVTPKAKKEDGDKEE